ncbi:MAG: hypothetical protein ABR600_05330 [Actinomycetota bacterium]
MRATRLVVAAGIAVGLTASSAAAAGTFIRPTFKTSDVYFHCNGQTKVYQANWASTLGDESVAVPWDGARPAQSVESGAGCGGADWGGTTNPLYDVEYKGIFTGNLRDLTIRLYQFLTNNVRQTSTETLRLYAEVDGKAIFPPGAQPNNGRTVTLTPVRTNSGATDLFEFSITNIGFADPVYDANGQLIDVKTGGAALEDGDGVEEHTLMLYIGLHGTAVGQDPAGHKGALWAWDTSEVPSGITFNPSDLADATVKADLPDFSDQA